MQQLDTTKKIQKKGGVGLKHHWVKSTDYSIKCAAGHYIACTNHPLNKKIYTLYIANNGGKKHFEKASLAKQYVEDNFSLHKETSQ